MDRPIEYRRLSLRCDLIDKSPAVVLDRPERVAAFCSHLLRHPQEVFFWIGLDCRKQVVATQELFIGSVDCCIAHPREVFRNAFVVSPTVAGIILVHNHPSGVCEPSKEDLRFFEDVSEAGKLLRVPVIDCLVVAEDGAWSREAGTIVRPAAYMSELPHEEEGPWWAEI